MFDLGVGLLDGGVVGRGIDGDVLVDLCDVIDALLFGFANLSVSLCLSVCNIDSLSLLSGFLILESLVIVMLCPCSFHFVLPLNIIGDTLVVMIVMIDMVLPTILSALPVVSIIHLMASWPVSLRFIQLLLSFFNFVAVASYFLLASFFLPSMND